MSEPLFVTGTAGFIGSHFTRRLLQDGHHVVGLDSENDYYPVSLKTHRVDALKAEFGDALTYIKGDLCDLDLLNGIFKEHQPSHVCHLAAQAGVRYSLENPHAYGASNLDGFLNILEVCRHHDIQRLVFASSSSVYGGNTKLPFSESDPTDTPVSLYAATKKSNEMMAHSYSHLYGIQCIGLRFFTVYGEAGRPDMATWIFTDKILNDDPIPVFNNGQMQRDFTYIDDIVSGVFNAVFKDGLAQFDIYNLGNHQSIPLLDMITVLEDALGKKAVKDMKPMQPGDVMATYADISKAEADLDFHPETSIEVGIPAFCKWLSEHPDIAQDVYQWRQKG